MAKLQFGKLTYISEKPFEFNQGLRIEYEEGIPESFNKYYYPSKYSIDALNNSQFYFSHPYQFNDLTDSNPLSFNYENLQFKDFAPFFNEKLNVDEIKNLYRQDKETGFQYFRMLFFSLWTQKIGVLCLTTNEMHNLMWGHYSTDSGFKIKYNAKKLIESINIKNSMDCMLFPINYIKEKLQVDTNKYGFHLPLLLDFSTKVHDWEYENEWRVVMTKNDMNVPNSLITPWQKDYNGRDDRLVEYDIESIEEIVLGMNFFNGNNTENIDNVSPTENILTIKDGSLIEFMKILSSTLDDKVMKAGVFIDAKESTYEGTAPMKRSLEKIKIKVIQENQFLIERTNPGYLRKF